jgi:hypothetical protein
MNLSVHTPLDEAVEEISRRRQDGDLKEAVIQYLNNDIPNHFKDIDPIMYLCRHVATPNYETLRFVELAKSTGLPMVIGQDLTDIFVSNNTLKRALGKMPVTRGVTRDGQEIIEHLTVVDFAEAQGERLADVRTKQGTPLSQFHDNLLRQFYPKEISIVDEAQWIDRHGRGDIGAHYKKLLGLLITHGIMFEFYEPDEIDFVHEVLFPAFSEVESHFGHRPLIVNLVDDSLASLRNWNSYPSVIYQFVKSETTTSCEPTTI